MKASFLSAQILGLGLIAATGSGCIRLGNNVEQSTEPRDSNPSDVTGWYQTEPQSLRFCATTSTGTTCRDAPLNLVPFEIAGVMSNPVGVDLDDRDSGGGYLVSTQSYGFETWVEDDRTISYLGSDTNQPLWEEVDPACKISMYMEQRGLVDQSSGPGSIGEIQTRGRLSLEIQMIREYTLACTNVFQAMMDCYNDITQCRQDTADKNQKIREQIQAMFNPFIEAGVMTATEVPTLVNLAYTVLYR